MPSTIEQIKQAILKRGGKASKHWIARELKISLDYASLILGELKRKGEVVFADGFYALTSVKKDATQEEKRGKSVVSKPAIKQMVCEPKKAKGTKKKTRTSKAGKKKTSPLSNILGISESLVRRLVKAGYATLESLANAPISMLMGSAKLKLKKAAQLINQARKKISR